MSTVGCLKEVKDLARQKKIGIWNEVIERANADFEGSIIYKERVLGV